MTSRWWDEPPGPSKRDGGRRPPPDFGRRTPRRRPFPRWSISAVAFGIQWATTTVILFVLAMVGLFSAPFFGLAGADPSERSLLAVAILVVVAVRLFALTLQVRYIARQNAEGAISACLGALVAGTVVESLAGLAGVPSIGVAAIGVIVEVTVVAVLIRPAQTRTW